MRKREKTRKVKVEQLLGWGFTTFLLGRTRITAMFVTGRRSGSAPAPNSIISRTGISYLQVKVSAHYEQGYAWVRINDRV